MNGVLVLFAPSGASENSPEIYLWENKTRLTLPVSPGDIAVSRQPVVNPQSSLRDSRIEREILAFSF